MLGRRRRPDPKVSMKFQGIRGPENPIARREQPFPLLFSAPPRLCVLREMAILEPEKTPYVEKEKK
jgi:hypothetical protein